MQTWNLSLAMPNGKHRTQLLSNLVFLLATHLQHKSTTSNPKFFVTMNLRLLNTPFFHYGKIIVLLRVESLDLHGHGQ